MRALIQGFDIRVIGFLRKMELPMARFAIFAVYFWFGLLKLLGLSPATPLVYALFEKTISVMPFAVFYGPFAIFEIAIGVLFLVRGLERVAICLLALHLATTILPLIFLPHIAWQAFLVPTLEGQYIIKNILIAALAIVIGSRLAPMSLKSRLQR